MSNGKLSVAVPGHMSPELGLRRPAGEVLAGMGFDTSDFRSAVFTDGMRFQAAQSPHGWCVSRAGRQFEREAILPGEECLSWHCAPIEVMAALYTLWRDVYPAATPREPALVWGKQWLAFRREVTSLLPSAPTLWVDRVFFRQCLQHVEKCHDWCGSDYQIHFSQQGAQLMISALDTEVFCPAQGQWLGAALVSAQAMFRHLPKRFACEAVPLEVHGHVLKVAGRAVPAQWVEFERAA